MTVLTASLHPLFPSRLTLQCVGDGRGRPRGGAWGGVGDGAAGAEAGGEVLPRGAPSPCSLRPGRRRPRPLCAQVLRQHSINLSEEEFFHILEYYDKSLSAKISYNDFLRAFLQ